MADNLVDARDRFGREHGRQALAVLLSVLTLASLLGCASKPFAHFTFVTTEDGVVRPLVLEKGVSRSWCITHTPLTTLDWTLRANPLIADQSYAIELAIASVPGANVMTDVSVQGETTDYFFATKNCVTVTGDIGRIIP